MRKLIYFALIAAMIAVACKKEKANQNQNLVLGKWRWYKYTYNALKNGKIDSSSTVVLGYTETLTFNADGTGVDKGNGGLNLPFDFTYQVKGDSLIYTILYPYNDYRNKIVQLTSSTLELKSSGIWVGPGLKYDTWQEDDIYVR